ncbi:MAG: DNA sulfur modification protein DndE [Flavobacteriales bacterium]
MVLREDADNNLSAMAGWTGLRPNVLARMGLCVSLEEPTIPNIDDYPADSDREFNRYTLTGEWDKLFIALLRQRCLEDDIELEEENLIDQFKAHLNRGILLLSKRVKSHEDLGRLVNLNLEEIEEDLEAA